MKEDRKADRKARKQEAKRLIKIWKKRLNLDDWRVKFKYVDLEEGSGAQIETNRCRQTAVIWFNTGIRLKNSFDTITLEEIIVHELVHIHLVSMFPPVDGSMREVVAEQAVNKLTLAFLKAYKAH